MLTRLLQVNHKTFCLDKYLIFTGYTVENPILIESMVTGKVQDTPSFLIKLIKQIHDNTLTIIQSQYEAIFNYIDPNHCPSQIGLSSIKNSELVTQISYH